MAFSFPEFTLLHLRLRVSPHMLPVSLFFSVRPPKLDTVPFSAIIARDCLQLQQYMVGAVMFLHLHVCPFSRFNPISLHLSAFLDRFSTVYKFVSLPHFSVLFGSFCFPFVPAPVLGTVWKSGTHGALSLQTVSTSDLSLFHDLCFWDCKDLKKLHNAKTCGTKKHGTLFCVHKQKYKQTTGGQGNIVDCAFGKSHNPV